MGLYDNIAGQGAGPNRTAGCVEALIATERTVDRQRREAFEAPARLAEQQRQQQEKEKQDRANKRIADKMARECQDKLDIQAGTLIIQQDGFRARKNPITQKWEHEVLYN